MTKTKAPIKVGMITLEPHGRPWAEVIARNMPELKMECAWDYNPERARWYADKYNIPHVVERVEDMLGKVDAVLIGGGRRPPSGEGIWGEETDDHLLFSRPFLENSKAVLIDKPFADRLEDAIEMVSLARGNHALLMSSSPLRYASELIAAKEVVDYNGLGLISGATCFIGCGLATLKWYIIHILEGVFVNFGPGIECVFALPSHGLTVIGKDKKPRAYGLVFRWRDGRIATITMVQDQTDAAEGKGYSDREPRILWPTATVIAPYLPFHYNIRIYGDMDWIEIRTVGKGSYTNELKAFLKMIETGEEAIPLEHTLELTQAIVMAEKSVHTGQLQMLRPIEEIMPQI
ncbi:MAG: Gfo/Idh/MocA family oxidoreductase [Candidatus Atribacteria bacterium]|nr:Gfo/Idh/MocA family oxidoreductase [Candidatus Atribacteria bacterium]